MQVHKQRPFRFEFPSEDEADTARRYVANFRRPRVFFLADDDEGTSPQLTRHAHPATLLCIVALDGSAGEEETGPNIFVLLSKPSAVQS